MENFNSLPPILEKIARESLNETPDKIQSGIEILRKWLVESPHLKSRNDSEFLLAFLRQRKHNIELAKERIDKFYTFRNYAPEVYANRDPCDPKISSMIAGGIFVRIPQPHPDEGSRIIIYSPRVLLETNTLADDLLKCGAMALDYFFVNDNYINIGGGRLIIDFTGLTFNMKLLASITIDNLKKWLILCEQCYPFRIKGFHLVKLNDAPSAVLTIIKTLIRLMHPKLRNRIFYHDDFESLYEYIPKTILPIEYGGDGGKLIDLIKPEVNEFLKSGEYFQNDQKYGTDESKRIGKSKLPINEFGTQGSFRKLNID